MSHKKKGANQGDINFIEKCAKGGSIWSVERISNHLRIEERVVKSFYDRASGAVPAEVVKKNLDNSDFLPPEEEFA